MAGPGGDANWWRSVADQADVPIAELVDGFTDIADRRIQYGWLPVRAHTAFSSEATHWSDLSSDTMSTLAARPGSGAGTVRALLRNAADTVEQHRIHHLQPRSGLPEVLQRLIDRFDDYDRGLLSARIWPTGPQSTEKTAAALGVAQVNVHRNQPRVVTRFQDLLTEPWHRPIIEAAQALRNRLGTLTRAPAIAAALDEYGLGLDTPAGQIVVHIAGPYREVDGWLEIDGTLVAAATALAKALDQRRAPTLNQLAARFANVGITAAVTEAFADARPGVRRFGDQWVRWQSGAMTGDRAEAALHLAGVPCELDEIAAIVEINESARARAYLRDVLNADRRFTRTTRASWGLARWGLREYSGIYDEIGTCIDAAGGTTSTAQVIAEVTAIAPDVTEKSVRAFMGTPGYIIENGLIRRRTAADPWRKPPPVSAARGVYRNGRQIRVAMPVDSNLLRGAGMPFPATAADALGIAPGDEETFTGDTGAVLVQWRLSSNRGPTLGSVRIAANTLGAANGDTLVLGFKTSGKTVDVTLIAAAATPSQRLLGLLGKRARDPRAAMAKGLRCEVDEVENKLRIRGDGDVAELLRPHGGIGGDCPRGSPVESAQVSDTVDGESAWGAAAMPGIRAALRRGLVRLINRHSAVLIDDPDLKRQRNPAQLRQRNSLARELASSIDELRTEVHALDRAQLYWVDADKVKFLQTASKSLSAWTPGVVLPADTGMLCWAIPASDMPFRGHGEVPWEATWWWRRPDGLLQMQLASRLTQHPNLRKSSGIDVPLWSGTTLVIDPAQPRIADINAGSNPMQLLQILGAAWMHSALDEVQDPQTQ